ncbi:hypothetical protein ACIOKD_01225 [Streptomyces sp. NPDC087844]|uniref:hypothetical protein n=1 Tax=Streptomyces sp. NPDC087844 TaxID=3365805 RepID=UPI003828D9C3
MTIPCGSCGRADQWPRPELDCPCGTVLRVPVAGAGPDAAGPTGAGRTEAGRTGAGRGGTGSGATGACPGDDTEAHACGADGHDGHDGHDGSDGSDGSLDPIAPVGADGPVGPDNDGDGDKGDKGPEYAAPPEAAPEGAGQRPPTKPRPRPRSQRLPAAVSPPLPLPLPRGEPAPRPAFQPVTIRTARDAVTSAALYLRWLGYRDIRRADQRPPSGIGLAARGIVAQVDPTVRPASLRDVECLWLTAMTESSGCVYFSLAGYEKDARARADLLGVPLFVLDLTGTPQPANSLAEELVATGA